MEFIGFLIVFPFVVAAALALTGNNTVRKAIVYPSCVLIIAAAVTFAANRLIMGNTVTYLSDTAVIDKIMFAAEFFLMGLVVFLSIKYKKYYAAVLSVAQTLLVAWLELFGHKSETAAFHILCDRLAVIMCLIIAVVGCLICVYAIGYMKDYHQHHTEFKDRRRFFFAMLFVFLGAMFGLVLSSNLIWIYFFWEITSISSFLLIGYTKTDEAVNNSFRALWMNLLGGLGFAIGIVYAALVLDAVNLQDLIGSGSELAVFPVIMLAFAGLTKSAQMPFSKWLLGAMVAPTPSSALLHSATMVKAGVYLLIRLAPAMHGNISGTMVSFIGGFTFLVTSMIAITHTDGKKVLAYSTISNLGLITACAGIGTVETIWAGVMLMIFHAVSKSLLFQAVGSIENATGSRDVEDMHGLIIRQPGLAAVMVIGIAGMYLAPFGMLVSKWAALKSFIDAGNVILVLFICFGSATTLFYWTKWLCKIIACPATFKREPMTTSANQWCSIIAHAAVMIILCILLPLISTRIVTPYLSGVFGHVIEVIRGQDMIIMIGILFSMFIFPMLVNLNMSKFNPHNTLSYMGGINLGDHIHFVDSFDNEKKMYLSNWYMDNVFGETKLWRPSVIVSSACLVIFIVFAIGGVM